MVDDAELLRRYTETHSEPAFTELVGRHLNLVYFTALRGTGGDSALAQDVTQAVFSIVARRARTLVTHATLTGWLYTTTRYTAARAKRKERTRQSYENEAAINDMLAGGPEHDWARLRPIIDEVLGELKSRDREAILLRFFEGRPFAEIGATWRISHDAARMRVERALEKLRGALERRGINSVSTALATLLATQGGLAAPAGLAATVSSTALVAATPSGIATFFGIMSGSKIIIGTAAIAVTLATGVAVLNHNRAEAAELRLEAVTRELMAARVQLARAEQQRSAAENNAAEAEKDNGALLAAVEAARAKSELSSHRSPMPSSGRAPFSNDPLTQTLQALFPNGVVATIGDRVITVDEVRREATPLLPKVQHISRNQDELRLRLYALQNSVIADLVSRQLNIKEFHHQTEGEAPKQIAAQMIDDAMADRMRNQFGNDQAKFIASLATQGLTMAQYRQRVEEDIIQAYMRGQQRKLPPAKDGQSKSASP